ncbi:unnamed protein product [Cylindrotheca closterium]|uniref:Proline dehydrogenase n=1 Tax=Cylindrotheca closterium TaxID=2856 RepID=A0AAD2FGC4_9STRA|nr:unnamed protein product [Cylindrotheca closterium]
MSAFATIRRLRPLNTRAYNHLSSRYASTATLDLDDFDDRASNNQNPVPDFSDAQSAYQAKSNAELFRAAACFRLCQIPILVSNADRLLRVATRISPTLTDKILKQTLYGHFCAGEDRERIQPVIDSLNSFGVGAILDYAAESDDPASSGQVPDEAIQPTSAVAREYDYESEAKCDKHLDTFLQCINDVAAGSDDGYAAIKVTALGNPKLLARVSQAFEEAKQLFAKFDQNGDGLISREEFEKGYRYFFTVDESTLKNVLDEFDPNNTGTIDYFTWSMMLQPKDLPKITSSCKETGPLAMATPTDEELELIEAMYQRGYKLAKEADRVGTRLLIDAEQVRYQPAIDGLVTDLQQSYNDGETTDKAIIYNTYQCYLKDASERLQLDVQRAERFGYHFGAKLVRGAYMESERELAASKGVPSPIVDTIEETHANYDAAVDFLLKHSAASKLEVEFMLASHNQASIEKAIESMNRHNISRKSPTICFAQLYGMSDHLSFNLGKHGYRVYKYLPYGEVGEVMPYLLRRANENSAIAAGTASELTMVKTEIGRRLRN